MSTMESVTFIVLFAFCWRFASMESVYVDIKQGTVMGELSRSRSGVEYRSFYGIPFAKPPVGNLRFEPPHEPDNWEGVRNATIPPPMCVQTELFGDNPKFYSHVGQEDCLYLNVFTPNVSESRSLPTLVYIHGGAYFCGAASIHDPHYLMDHPIVVVMIQYRLNVFGFLSAADDVLPGNYGMKDQVAALKWVQKNIHAFGGDPNRVTIMGESAGASSVHMHMHSELSKGTFQQAISQSGSALALWSQISPNMARRRAHALATLTGCPSIPTSALLECLKKLPVSDLFYASNKLYVWDRVPIILYSIVVEPKSVKGAFLTENPWKKNLSSNVPWITGLVKDEGTPMATPVLSNPKLLENFEEQYERLFPLTFYYGEWLDTKNASHVTNAIKQYYFKGGKMSLENADQFVNMYTDSYFAYDSMEAARRHTGNVYFYHFNHRNSRTYNEIFGTYSIGQGVSHADDLLTFFYMPLFFPKITEGTDDYIVSQRLIKYWVNFISSGNPNGEDNTWKPITSKDFEYLHISTHSDKMEKNLWSDRMNFWNNLQVSRSSDSSESTPNYDEL